VGEGEGEGGTDLPTTWSHPEPLEQVTKFYMFHNRALSSIYTYVANKMSKQLYNNGLSKQVEIQKSEINRIRDSPVQLKTKNSLKVRQREKDVEKVTQRTRGHSEGDETKISRRK
jgi:hypothetical protein